MQGKMRLLGVFVCALVFLGFVAEGEARRIRVGIPAPSISQVAFYVARDKGYYEEEGLDVQLILMRAPIANVALLARELDFTGIPTAALGASLRGATLKILSTTFERPLFSLMSKTDIQKIDDLKGKKVGTSGRGSADDVLMDELFSRYKLRAGRDFPLINAGNSPSRMAALMSGAVDATLLVLPWNLRAKKAGFRELVSLTRQDFSIFVGSVVAHQKLLDTEPGVVEKFLRATIKGLLYARSNRSGTVDILVRNIQTSRDLVEEMYEIAIPAMTENGTSSKEATQKFFRLVLKTQNRTDGPPLENFFDFSIAQKVNSQLKSQGWKP